MPRQKRSSAKLERALRRLAGMQSIGQSLTFSDDLSLAKYFDRIQILQNWLLQYNTMLSTVDEMAAQIKFLEQELGSYSEKMLMSIATRYGKDSLEYMKAGGKPRKRSHPLTSAGSSSETMAPMIATSMTTNGTTTNGTTANHNGTTTNNS